MKVEGILMNNGQIVGEVFLSRSGEVMLWFDAKVAPEPIFANEDEAERFVAMGLAANHTILWF